MQPFFRTVHSGRLTEPVLFHPARRSTQYSRSQRASQYKLKFVLLVQYPVEIQLDFVKLIFPVVVAPGVLSSKRVVTQPIRIKSSQS